jgi:hypothetical protein
MIVRDDDGRGMLLDSIAEHLGGADH